MRSYNPKHIDSVGAMHHAAPDAHGDTFHDVRRAPFLVHRPPHRRDAGLRPARAGEAAPISLKKPAP
ncbi:D-galactonate regulator, IclR family protein [Burkholderia stagnalis]